MLHGAWIRRQPRGAHGAGVPGAFAHLPQDIPGPWVPYGARVRGIEVASHGPRRKHDQRGNHQSPQIKMGVANCPRPELGKRRRKTSRCPRETNAPFKMTIKRAHKRDHRERDEIPPVDRQAPQPAQYRGPETRDQIRDISGRRCGPSRRRLGKIEPSGFLAFLFHPPSLFLIWRIPMRHYLRIQERYIPYHGTESTVLDKKIGNIRPVLALSLFDLSFQLFTCARVFRWRAGIPQGGTGILGSARVFPRGETARCCGIIGPRKKGPSPLGESDQQDDHYHPHIESSVSFGLRAKRGENTRCPASCRDRSANPAAEMTVERPPEHQ